MPGKVNVYSLGTEGVNRVKSPVHVPDGALLSAQNAEVSQDRGQRGLRKRAGMSRLTIEAGAGSILSMAAIPLPDPGDDELGGPGLTGILEIGIDGASPTTRVTADGTTFSNKTVMARPHFFSGGTGFKSYYYNGWLYYMSAANTIRRYNGVTDELECALPDPHPVSGTAILACRGFCGVGDRLFAFMMYDSSHRCVMATTIGSGTGAQFGDGWGVSGAGFLTGYSNDIGVFGWNGRVWASARDVAANEGYLYSAAPFDSNWTQTITLTGRYIQTVGSAGTSFFFSNQAVTGGVTNRIDRLDVDGTHTTDMLGGVLGGPTLADQACIGCHGDRVYAITQADLWRSTDNGVNWTMIGNNVVSSSPACTGKVTRIGTTYYICGNGDFFRDDGAGVTSITVGGGSIGAAFVRF